MIIYCPKCGSPSTFAFEREVLNIDENGQIHYVDSLYGCSDCNTAFTISCKTKPTSKQKMNKVKAIFNMISRSCNKVLENIK
jgi:hypothetical protein